MPCWTLNSVYRMRVSTIVPIGCNALMFNAPTGATCGQRYYGSPVKAETGYSRSTLYLHISRGLWTKPVRIGARSVGWPAAEVATLNMARIAGQTEAELRLLVQELLAARSSALSTTNADLPAPRGVQVSDRRLRRPPAYQVYAADDLACSKYYMAISSGARSPGLHVASLLGRGCDT